MADFEKALEYVIQNEGKGFSVDNIDQPTNSGITRIALADYRRVDRNEVNTSDVASLTWDEITAIYKDVFWDRLRLGEIQHTGKATCIFDTAVNQGQRMAVKYAQKACTALGSAIVIDGVMGMRTLSEINLKEPKDFIRGYEALVYIAYQALVEKTPSLSIYERGWLRRAGRLLSLISVE